MTLMFLGHICKKFDFRTFSNIFTIKIVERTQSFSHFFLISKSREEITALEMWKLVTLYTWQYWKMTKFCRSKKRKEGERPHINIILHTSNTKAMYVHVIIIESPLKPRNTDLISTDRQYAFISITYDVTHI